MSKVVVIKIKHLAIFFILGIASACCHDQRVYWLFNILALLSLIITIKYDLGLLLTIVCYLVGLNYANYKLQNPKNSLNNLLSRELALEGTITSIPINTPYGSKFLLQSSKIDGQKISTKIKILSKDKHDFALGQKWQFVGLIKPIVGLANWGSFDFEQYAMIHNISGKMQLKKDKAKLLQQSSSYRQILYQKLIKKYPLDKIGIFLALTLGVKEHLSSLDNSNYQELGIAHLLAISGLHLGMLAAVSYFVSYYLIARIIKQHTPQLAAITAIITTYLYCRLGGDSISSTRAFVMLLCCFLPYFKLQYLTIMDRLAIAAVLLLLYNPLLLLDLGFQLSFMAVLFLVFISCNQSQSKSLISKLKHHFAFSIILQPILAVHHLALFSFAACIANFLLIPFFTFIIPLSLLAIIFVLFDNYFLLDLAVHIINLTSSVINYFAKNLSSTLVLASLSYWQALVICCCLYWMLLAGLPGRLLASISLLLLLKTTKTKIATGDFVISMLDVGQGLSIVVETKSHTILYDAGPSSESFDCGSAVIKPYLNYLGKDKIDLAIISHTDNDHLGGLRSLHADNLLDWVITSLPSEINFTKADLCLAGQSFKLDKVNFEFLHPQAAMTAAKNDLSCVLKITGVNTSALLTGDIGFAAEDVLLNKNALSADIVQIPHHGSRYSSSDAFINKIKPKIAIVSAAKNNSYGHPHPDALKRYQAAGVAVFNTATLGAIRVFYDYKRQAVRLETKRN